MKRLIELLRGKKTYICAIGLFLTYGAEGIGLISVELASVLKGLFAGGGMASIRSSLK